jgi:uncharacterized RDD family membrane protein YckC
LTALQSVLRVIAALAIFLATFFRPDPVPDPLLLREWLSLVGVIALAGGYFIVLHSDPGQTLGKALFRLRVVTTEGGPLGLPQSCLRLVGYIFSALPLGFGFLLAAFPPGRALHDQLAGSKVVVLPERVARSNAEVRA